MGVLVVSGGLAFGVSNYKNAKAAVNGLSLLVSATFNLSMVFVPQVRPKSDALHRCWDTLVCATVRAEESYCRCNTQMLGVFRKGCNIIIV